MIWSEKNKRLLARACCALLLVCGFLYATRFISAAAKARPVNNTRQTEAQAADPEKFLFVWAGDQTRRQPGFLAVINFDEKSNDYGKVITDWNIKAGEIVVAAGMATPVANRAMAIVHTAVYEAVNAITRRYPDSELRLKAAAGASVEAAVAAANHATLAKLAPDV